MLTTMNKEASSAATYLSARQAEPALALEEGFEPGAKPFNSYEGEKVEFPCKGYQEYKCLFNKLFFEMPFPFW